jgi:lysophospholipase L1-like esterase
MIVFGDEASLLVAPSTPNGIDARKYTNNGLVPGTTLPQNVDCRVNRLWVQELALEYSLVFAECNPDNAPVTAQMRATAGAKVADVVTAVDAFLATSAPVPTDLITMMVGTNDIVELYNGVISSSLGRDAAVAAALTEARARGLAFAGQINRLVNSNNTKGRVMYSTVPYLNTTPFGQSKSTADRSLLNSLTQSFNDGIRTRESDGGVKTNGRSLGFLDAAQTLFNIYDEVDRRGGDVDSITNVRAAACQNTVNLLLCTDRTLVSGATYVSHLWAGDINFSAAGHIILGDDAVNLATGLPW